MPGLYKARVILQQNICGLSLFCCDMIYLDDIYKVMIAIWLLDILVGKYKINMH